MISQQSFEAVTAMFQRVSGIQLGAAKRALVTGRLQRLAQESGAADIDSFVQDLLHGNDAQELVRVVDKLTTNETYFFREPEHFEFLAVWAPQRAAAQRGAEFRVWSAASSSGEEAYSIAMVLAEGLGSRAWQVQGTDLSTAMVEAARKALYPMERARHVPPVFLKRHCLKGEGDYAGQLLIGRGLRERVRFTGANLMQPLPDIGDFDLIFLRNVLIYFDPPAKTAIVRRVLQRLRPGGLLFTGHSESLNGLDVGVRSLKPAIYERA